MRQANLHFVPEITRVLPFGEGQLYVEAKVEVFDDKKKTISYASMTKMPHSDGQTHFAQVCITRAMKTAVLRHLQISDHDILMVIDAYGFDPKQMSTRSVTNEVEEAEVAEAPVEAMPDLGDLGV
jgi:hypothetical protein